MIGKQLVQGCYTAARVGVEPTTIELQGRSLSTELLHPVIGNPDVVNKKVNVRIAYKCRSGVAVIQ